jgi:hypothetical protein
MLDGFKRRSVALCGMYHFMPVVQWHRVVRSKPEGKSILRISCDRHERGGYLLLRSIYRSKPGTARVFERYGGLVRIMTRHHKPCRSLDLDSLANVDELN